ncbi:MAG: TylF/MycF/NovP-related O-methyltransferase [Gemmatimonadales bacterium]|nr:TylF/MycF/NovP-related O-methyltransferase [Gemmatimonadales bacterium]
MLGRLLLSARRAAWRFLGQPPLTPESFTSANGNLRAAASFLAWNQVPGDYLEFGTWKGESFIEAYRAVQAYRGMVLGLGHTDDRFRAWAAHAPRFFAFDSFEGLPGGDAERQADYAEGAYACSEEQFLANVTGAGVPRGAIVTVKGFYDATLTPATKQRIGLRRAALAMIDCDLYESTVPVLEFLTDVVGQGSILVFHDWYRFQARADQGEQRACAEWLARNPDITLEKYWQEGPQSVAFLVHRRG